MKHRILIILFCAVTSIIIFMTLDFFMTLTAPIFPDWFSKGIIALILGGIVGALVPLPKSLRKKE